MSPAAKASSFRFPDELLARVDAYAANRRLTTDDIIKHTASMVPLSKTMSEQIKAIRDWAFDRAARASRAKPNY